MKKENRVTGRIILKIFLLILAILSIFAFVSIIESLTIRSSIFGLIIITALYILCDITISARDLVYIKNIFSRN